MKPYTAKRTEWLPVAYSLYRESFQPASSAAVVLCVKTCGGCWLEWLGWLRCAGVGLGGGCGVAAAEVAMRPGRSEHKALTKRVGRQSDHMTSTAVTLGLDRPLPCDCERVARPEPWRTLQKGPADGQAAAALSPSAQA